MLPEATFRFPSRLGVDLDPDLEQYFDSLEAKFTDYFRRQTARANNPKYIRVAIEGGRVGTLDNALKELGAWPYELKLYSGTMAEARRLGNLHGWEICDGRGRTPDLRHRFIRGASSEDAGETGGRDCHVHDSHSEHVHYGWTGCPSSGLDVCTCSGSGYAAAGGHIHPITTTGVRNASGTPITLIHEEENHVPTYYEVIILRKKP